MKRSVDEGQLLTTRQGETLLALARQTLEKQFGIASQPPKERDLADTALQTLRGTFVTLKIDDQLRGCIGSLSPTAPIATNVRENAVHAALHDPRFAPLRKEELAKVRIEVSVLTEPVPLDYADGDDLLSTLQPGIDGVIIRKGSASATFLPQVWEQLPTPEAFLSHLCKKAGLSADQWQEGDLSVDIYQVQYFEEEG